MVTDLVFAEGTIILADSLDVLVMAVKAQYSLFMRVARLLICLRGVVQNYVPVDTCGKGQRFGD